MNTKYLATQRYWTLISPRPRKMFQCRRKPEWAPTPEGQGIFHQFSDDIFLLVTLNMTTFLVVSLQRVHLYRPLYQTLWAPSDVTLPLHRHIRSFTTNGALSPRDGDLLSPWAPFPGREAGLWSRLGLVSRKMWTSRSHLGLGRQTSRSRPFRPMSRAQDQFSAKLCRPQYAVWTGFRCKPML